MGQHKCGFGVATIALCGVALLAGCATEKVRIDYVMPARQIRDAESVKVLAIVAQADVAKADLGAPASNRREVSKQAAGMLKQLTSARLYKEGYVQTVDNIFGAPEGSKSVQDFAKIKESQHGHASFASENHPEVATLTLKLAITELASKQVEKEREFILSTIPYKVKAEPGKVPLSTPDKAGIEVEKVKKTYHVWQTTVTGELTATVVSKSGKRLYSATYPVAMPEASAWSAAAPSEMKALSVAIAPAIDHVIRDISPYREAQDFEPNTDSDEKVLLLLEAKAFQAVIDTVDAMEEPTEADYENQGLAYEALGDFASARDSYKEALKLDSGSDGAERGLERIDRARAAQESVKESGAKKDASTTYKK